MAVTPRGMTMRGMTSMRFVAAVGVMAFVGACRCGTAPEECGTIDVNFVSPMNGDTVSSTISVSINATRDGGAVDVLSATVATRLASSGTEFSTPRDATTTSGNQATFSG